jgi:hypothetical protein
VVALEEGLVVEGVDLRGAAVHEQEDDALGAGGEVGGADGEGIGGGAGLFEAEEAGQGEGAEAGGGGVEEVAAGHGVELRVFSSGR